MDPRDFQQIAERLVGGTCAAEFRTAISRAYYATYNVSVEILEGMNFRIPGGSNGHGNVQRRLSNCGEKEIIKVGSQIGDLHSKRIQADYYLDNSKTENKKTAEAIVRNARKLIQILDNKCWSSNRQKIIDAIKEYDRKTSGGRV
jgi:hypothetical protein